MENDGNGDKYLKRIFVLAQKVDATMTLYKGDTKYQFRKKVINCS